MSKFINYGCLLLLACMPLVLNAALPVKPFVKGSFAEIQKAYENESHIIVFWSENCAYCMKELAMLGALKAQQPQLNLVTVVTDPFLDEKVVQDKLASFGLENTETWVFAADYPETLYFDVDKRWRGELPLTFLFDKQGQKIKKSGLLKKQDITSWLAGPEK